jgi:hypothetical protein
MEVYNFINKKRRQLNGYGPDKITIEDNCKKCIELVTKLLEKYENEGN